MIINANASDVTWISSSQTDAPVLESTEPNGLLKILDFCLLSGGAVKSVSSVAINENEVTFTFSSGHNLSLHQIVDVSGADAPQINGKHKIIASTVTTITIVAVGALISTGTITVKLASLGYESIFGTTDPTKRAYRSLSPTSSKKVLYLDMSYPDSAKYHATSPARRAMVSVCEDMQSLGVQINSLTSLINNKPSNKNGRLFWYQCRDRHSSLELERYAIPWVVIGNGDFFYIAIAWSSYNSNKSYAVKDVYGFGDYVSLDSSVSSSSVFLMASDNADDNSTIYPGDLGATFSSITSSATGAFINSNGVFDRRSIIVLNGVTAYSGYGSGPYPSSIGDFLFTSVLKIIDDNDSIIGFMPNYLFIEHSMGGDHDGSIIDGCYIVKASRSQGSSPSTANVAFYVGA